MSTTSAIILRYESRTKKVFLQDGAEFKPGYRGPLPNGQIIVLVKEKGRDPVLVRTDKNGKVLHRFVFQVDGTYRLTQWNSSRTFQRGSVDKKALVAMLSQLGMEITQLTMLRTQPSEISRASRASLWVSDGIVVPTDYDAAVIRGATWAFRHYVTPQQHGRLIQELIVCPTYDMHALRAALLEMLKSAEATAE